MKLCNNKAMLDRNVNYEALGLLGDNTLADNESGMRDDALVAEIAEPTVAERIGRLEARGIDDATICAMFQMSSEELQLLRDSSEYDEALATGQQQQTERPLQIDDSWDDVESTALNKLRGTVANEYDSDRLLKIASIANRATRRSERAKPGEIDASNTTTNVVSVNFSPLFIQQLQAIDPNAEHKRIQQMAAKRNMVDYLPQNEFEKVIKDNVNTDLADEVEDAVAMLDLMVMGE